MIDDIARRLSDWIGEIERYRFGACGLNTQRAYESAMLKLRSFPYIPPEAVQRLINLTTSMEWSPRSAYRRTGLFLSAVLNSALAQERDTRSILLDFRLSRDEYLSAPFPPEHFLYGLENADVTVLGNFGNYFLDHARNSTVRLIGRSDDYACRAVRDVNVCMSATGNFCGIDGESGRIFVRRAGNNFSARNRGMHNYAVRVGEGVASGQLAGSTTVFEKVGRDAARDMNGGRLTIPYADKTAGRRMRAGELCVVGEHAAYMAPGRTGGVIRLLRDGIEVQFLKCNVERVNLP